MGISMQKYTDAIVADICELVKIPSVYAESDEYLFGEEVDKCLDKALEMMANLGFRTFKAEDGAYGYAEIGEGEMLAVLGHLDVVNARKEDGWDTDPFNPQIIDGILYGRGTQDDKGPIVISAYALKALLDEGHKLRRRVRFILGLDEESLWRSISKYTEREEAPAMGFSPDAGFPLTYAEKGVLQLYIKGNMPSKISYKGGDSFNAVSPIAWCQYDTKVEEALKELGHAYYVEDGNIYTTGKTAHALQPWEGVNANLHLLEALEQAGYADDAIRFMNDSFQNDKFRFEGFTDKEHELSDFSGPVTNCFSQMEANENGVRFSVDLRLPVSVTKEQILEIMSEKAAKYGMTVEPFDWLAPIHVPKEGELINSLMEAYQEVTDDMVSEPQISGGATYARAFKGCVAYGACFPDTLLTEHEPNERVMITEMIQAAEVFKKAFEKLVVAK